MPVGHCCSQKLSLLFTGRATATNARSRTRAPYIQSLARTRGVTRCRRGRNNGGEDNQGDDGQDSVTVQHRDEGTWNTWTRREDGVADAIMRKQPHGHTTRRYGVDAKTCGERSTSRHGRGGQRGRDAVIVCDGSQACGDNATGTLRQAAKARLMTTIWRI